MRVADVIMGARQYMDGAQRSAGAEQLRVAVETEMPVRYAMPFPPDAPSTFLRRGAPTRTRRGQWHELVQHLTDLAYLTVDRFQEWHAVRERGEVPEGPLLLSVLEGVTTYVAEDDYADFRLLPAPPKQGIGDRIDWVERYLSTLVYRLGQLTSFDGELPLRETYRIGEASAFGRSLAFRMRVFIYDYRVDRHSGRRKAYFDRDHLPQLIALTSFVDDQFRDTMPDRATTSLSPKLQQLLLSWDELFGAYRNAHHIGPDGTGRYYLQYRIAGGSQAIDRDLDRRDERLRRRAARWVRRNDDHVDTGVNHFGVRLLQLGLWRAGFYTGKLDGDIGPFTHRGLTALIEQEREYGDLGDRRLDRVLLPGTESRDWIVDLRQVARLLERYVPPPLDEAQREEDQIWDRIRESGQEDRVDEAFANRQQEVSQLYGSPSSNPDRRVYYGLRGLIRGAFRAVGQIIKWIGGLIAEILGAVFDFVKSVAKRIQEGIGMFFAGFRFFAHYLLGRPFISVGKPDSRGEFPVLSTRFRIDFDVVSFIDRGATYEDIARHTANLRRSHEGAAYFLAVISTCLRAITLLQPPLGWLRLAVLLARIIHGFLRGDRRNVRPAVA